MNDHKTYHPACPPQLYKRRRECNEVRVILIRLGGEGSEPVYNHEKQILRRMPSQNDVKIKNTGSDCFGVGLLPPKADCRAMTWVVIDTIKLLAMTS